MKKAEKIPSKMHALVLESIGNLEYKEVDNYKLKKDWVLVKIKYCGICSSDIERVFVNGTYHFPTIPGHEMSGTIIAVNDEDSELLNKNVCIFPMLPCMECESCKNKEYAQCSNYNYFGSRCDGGYAEYLLVPKWNLVYINPEIDLKIAALAEPSAVSLHAVNILDTTKYKKIAVNGTGTIAFLIAFFINAKNGQATIVGRNKEKLKIAREWGLNVLNIDDIDKYKDSFDASIEAVGTNQSINQSISLVKAFGKVVLVGNPKEDVLLDKKVYWKILRKQLLVTGSWNSTYNDKVNDWKETISFMEKSNIPFEKLITKEYDLSSSDEAFDFLINDKSLKFKVVFKND